MREIAGQVENIQSRHAARLYGRRHGLLVFFNMDQQAVVFDGGPGSGNFGHAGIPGTQGGSLPSGGAGCAATVERADRLEKALSSQSAEKQADYLVRSGAVPAAEAEALKSGAGSGDEAALQKLDEYKKEYFENVRQACMPKDSISSEERDQIIEMSDEEVQEWLEDSICRDLTGEEEAWANPTADVQKAVIDAGLTDTPQVVCKEDFDEYVEENGATVLYRGIHDSDSAGMSAAEIIYQTGYIDGEAYMGNGAYGDGLYSAVDEESAEAFASDEDSIMKWALRTDASVLEYEGDEMDEAMMRTEYQNNDPSLAAVCSGYDAVHVDNGTSDYYVILNRAAVIMQDPMEDAAEEILSSS